jgi:hypothetical protein
MVSRIEEYLDGLPPLPGRMSIKSMKRDLGLKPEEKKLFTRALDAYLEQNPDAWRRDESKRSLVRTWLELYSEAS